MAETKKNFGRSCSTSPINHPSNFLPSLKKHPVYNRGKVKLEANRGILVKFLSAVVDGRKTIDEYS